MSALGKRKAVNDVRSAAASVIQSAFRKSRLRKGLSNLTQTLAMARAHPMALNRRGLASKETGFVDLASATYNLNTTGSIVLIPTIAQGASVNQRVGKKIKLKSLACRGMVYNDTAASLNDCCILIVYDRRPQASLPAITDILVAANSNAFNNDANSGRFQIMKREDFMLLGVPATGSTMTERSAASADFYLSLRNLPCTFKAAGTGAMGDIEEGALYLVTVGQNTGGSNNGAFAALSFRTRFIDV